MTTEARRPTYLMRNGQLVPYGEARVHVLSTAVKYAAGVYEGLRAYWSGQRDELYLFRTAAHWRRLRSSLSISRITGVDIAGDGESLTADLIRLINSNDLREDLHIRVQVLVEADDGSLGSRGPASIFMAAIPMGRMFDHGGRHVNISAWARLSDRSMPPRVKAAANYHNSRLALLQAQLDGYDDTILLTSYGKVAEGPGYNLMLVRDGQLIAPTRTDGILEGITRDTLLRIAPGLLGVPVVERSVDASELYVAEELFYCGSAAEVTPILSVDRHPVGDGSVGPITRALASEYEQIVRGSAHDERGWLTPVFGAQHSQSRSTDGKVRSVAPNQGA